MTATFATRATAGARVVPGPANHARRPPRDRFSNGLRRWCRDRDHDGRDGWDGRNDGDGSRTISQQSSRLFSRFLSRRACRLLLLTLLCCQAGPGHAITLGRELVLSALGDPVEVEIAVQDWQDVEFDSVEIRVASQGEYEAFGLDYLPVLDALNFNLVGPNSNGEVRVLVSTREPVAEPYIELLLVMRWSGGSLLREYVLLFDLPEDATNAVSAGGSGTGNSAGRATGADRVVMTGAGANRGPSSAEQGPFNARTEPAIAVDGTAGVGSAGEFAASGRRVYRVRDGDLLWNIAQQFVPAGASDNIYQMLLSLHDLNRAAFLNGNISLLKVGALLQIPDGDDLANVAAANARERFETRWQEGTRGMQVAADGQTFTTLNDNNGNGTPGAEEPTGSAASQSAEAPVAGMETGAYAGRANGPLLPDSTPAVLAVDASAAANGAGNSEPAFVFSRVTANSSGPRSLNPYLQEVATSAREVQALLENSVASKAAVEGELQALIERVRSTRIRIQQLNDSLERLLAEGGGQASPRNWFLLGGFLCFLLAGLALIATLLVMLFRPGPQPDEFDF